MRSCAAERAPLGAVVEVGVEAPWASGAGSAQGRTAATAIPPATRTAANATAVTGIQFLRVMLARSLLVGGAAGLEALVTHADARRPGGASSPDQWNSPRKARMTEWKKSVAPRSAAVPPPPVWTPPLGVAAVAAASVTGTIVRSPLLSSRTNSVETVLPARSRAALPVWPPPETSRSHLPAATVAYCDAEPNAASEATCGAVRRGDVDLLRRGGGLDEPELGLAVAGLLQVVRVGRGLQRGVLAVGDHGAGVARLHGDVGRDDRGRVRRVGRAHREHVGAGRELLVAAHLAVGDVVELEDLLAAGQARQFDVDALRVGRQVADTQPAVVGRGAGGLRGGQADGGGDEGGGEGSDHRDATAGVTCGRGLGCSGVHGRAPSGRVVLGAVTMR